MIKNRIIFAKIMRGEEEFRTKSVEDAERVPLLCMDGKPARVIFFGKATKEHKPSVDTMQAPKEQEKKSKSDYISLG